jgi:hypothetical protein
VFKQKNRTPLLEVCAASFSVICVLQIGTTQRDGIITKNFRKSTTFFQLGRGERLIDKKGAGIYFYQSDADKLPSR